MAAKYENLLYIYCPITYLSDLNLWITLKICVDITSGHWTSIVISRCVFRQTCWPFETKYHYLLMAGIAQWLQSMQSSGTSGSSELLELVPLHSVHTSLQRRPCSRHVHLFVLHSFLQLQDMMSSSFAGAAGLPVCIGRHFPSTMCHPILLASYCHLFF